ncbi:hypothetical protein [Streptomyces sp. NPDC001068]|uniref:hypothetical protein n=1 Tax=Streptomyces sp. NPDC001068 TaxID=3364544 RepID=UPI0036C021D0
MTVDQLPGRVREFADHLNSVLARLDQGGGWCAVFWQRDPDGMRACLGGREIPPWDVVEALLQDLASVHGPEAAARAADRARRLHAGALAAYDTRPGARAELTDRLGAMLREQRRAAERLARLGRAYSSAHSREEAESLDIDLAWARDDHERASARCVELRARIDRSPRSEPGPHHPANRTAPARDHVTGGTPDGGPSAGRPVPEQAAGTGGTVHGTPAPGSPAASAAGAHGVPAVGGAVPGFEAVSAAGPHGVPAVGRAVPGFAATGGAGVHGGPGGDPTASAPVVARGGGADGDSVGGASGGGPVAGDAAPGAGGADAAAAGREPVRGPAPAPSGRQRRRRGSARFAGMVEDEGAPGAVPQAPPAPSAVPGGRRTPRGARFAGAAEAPARPEPVAEQADREAERAVAGAVARLERLRGAGRTGEAHALLAEAARWPAARFPLLADALQHAGLGSDWATLLWESASLPPDRLVAAADALTAAGGTADARQILRQGVARPASEIGEAVLALETQGRDREVRALLDAYVRVRPPEEAAHSAEPDPRRLVPLLLRSALTVSDQRHWDLLHALRVAGLAS